VVTTAFLAGLLHVYLHHDLDVSVMYAMKCCFVYLATLASSIALYRNSPFHPLAAFPGPIWARTTQVWFFWYNYNGTTRLLIRRLHEKYGDFVRIVSGLCS
jgi:hypothetical protein